MSLVIIENDHYERVRRRKMEAETTLYNEIRDNLYTILREGLEITDLLFPLRVNGLPEKKKPIYRRERNWAHKMPEEESRSYLQRVHNSFDWYGEVDLQEACSSFDCNSKGSLIYAKKNDLSLKFVVSGLLRERSEDKVVLFRPFNTELPQIERIVPIHVNSIMINYQGFDEGVSIGMPKMRVPEEVGFFNENGRADGGALFWGFYKPAFEDINSLHNYLDKNEPMRDLGK